jgi:uroporphyrin-3 C-methyltransferase
MLRRALVRDIERLKALPLVDVYGTGARLDDAIAAIDRLPLAMDARVRPDAEAATPVPATNLPAWERVVREAWRELRQLVRVQSSGAQDAALLAPEQTFFLRENLKLRLLGARIALLSRDGKSYQDDLQAALSALERHFDVRDSSVATTAAALRKLQAAQVQIDLPDLQETLEALRKLRLPRAKGSA